MTVKELIEELSKYDENTQVCVYDRENYTYDDYLKVKKEVQSFMMGEDWKPIWSRIDGTLEEAEKATEKYGRDKAIRKDILVIYHDY